MKKAKKIKTIYYSDELNDEFSEAKIKAIPIDENYNYGSSSFAWKALHFLFYRIIALPIATVFLRLKYRHKIVNKNAIKQMKKQAFFLFANHTNPIPDALIPTFVAFPRQVFVVVHAANVSIPILGQSTKYLGAIPLPDNLAATKNFMQTLKMRLEQNCAICIYPEAHIWPFYTKIRPFSDAAFRYPVQYKVPTFCFTNTYQKRRFSKNPRIVTYIDGPFFADDNLSAKESRANLRNKVYSAMCERSKNNSVEMIHYERVQPKEEK